MLVVKKEFNGKTALVTGAAQGIGKSIAELLAKAGAKVILNDINQNILEKTTESLHSAGLLVEYYLADVSKDKEVEKMISDIIGKHSRLDILINNAGVSIKNPDNSKKTTLHISTEEWDFILGVNLRSIVTVQIPPPSSGASEK